MGVSSLHIQRPELAQTETNKDSGVLVLLVIITVCNDVIAEVQDGRMALVNVVCFTINNFRLTATKFS